MPVSLLPQQSGIFVELSSPSASRIIVEIIGVKPTLPRTRSCTAIVSSFQAILHGARSRPRSSRSTSDPSLASTRERRLRRRVMLAPQTCGPRT